MQLRRKSKLTSEVSTHSLNDIMFFLLLFFLIASTMANPNVIKVLLPKANSAQVFEKQKPFTLSITQDLDYVLESKHITRDQLESELKSLTGTNPEATVVLNIDGKVEWEKVVEVLDIGKALNVKMVAAARKK